MNIGKYKLISDWEIANTAHTALAEYDGKKHFLKKYNNYKMPRKNASTSAELYARQEEEFKAFVDYRTALNTKLGKIAQSGGNIILPSEWFVADNVFVEATEFIEGTVSEDTLFKLSDDDKYFLLLTAAGALKSLHSAGIIHSDLKRSNILVIKNAYGKYIAKIIDFDKSYFEGRPRVNDLGGDQCYVSPELAYCLMSDLAESGVKFARCQTGWMKCEKVPGQYDFQWLDEVVDPLAAIGIETWFSLSFGHPVHTPAEAYEKAWREANGKLVPGWARGWVGEIPLYHGEKGMKAWTEYVRALCRHFRGRVRFFEVWNEPEAFWTHNGVSLWGTMSLAEKARD